jgi:hypothetical protein
VLQPGEFIELYWYMQDKPNGNCQQLFDDGTFVQKTYNESKSLIL